MKTLVFFGSARSNGTTRAMLDVFLSKIEGEVEEINCYKLMVEPCRDCRYCLKVNKCIIKDEMVEIYQKIDATDNFIFAAPIYCYSVPGPMKTVIDRLQVYWAALVRKDKPEKFIKKGAYLLSGGGPSFENQFTGGELVLKAALHDINANFIGGVLMDDADNAKLPTRPDIITSIVNIAEQMNKN